MRKLKLDVADLEVASFDTDRSTEVRGTVAGHKTDPLATANGGVTCDNGETCYASCGDTCQGTCSGGVCGSWPLTYCPQCYYEV